MELHWAKCFISGSCVQYISNFQVNGYRYWHLELVPPSAWQPWAAMSVYKAKQQSSFLKRKKKRKEGIVASHPLYCFSPLESHEWYTGVELSTLQGHLSLPHTKRNKRNKICSENQKCIINGWHYNLIQWWASLFSQFSSIIWNINSCSGSSSSSNLMCMFTLGI